ncbi:hypothetical protein Cgig2_015882 [Carnegiea gigantea]|uniref:Uncharacterized protein n=1 Tax=Carnegiea gigantea TaxID=171969 RepID=A0A9Q1JMM0_9CARY|nr:hypothetical protein Cgig2_015882 [Carnegiea gigantea]
MKAKHLRVAQVAAACWSILLKKLSRALETSGVDLSKANISVELDLGKGSSTAAASPAVLYILRYLSLFTSLTAITISHCQQATPYSVAVGDEVFFELFKEKGQLIIGKRQYKGKDAYGKALGEQQRQKKERIQGHSTDVHRYTVGGALIFEGCHCPRNRLYPVHYETIALVTIIAVF